MSGATAPASVRRPAAIAAALLIAAVVFAVALLWAKWLPYAAKTATVAKSHTWSADNILAVGGVAPGDAPSWHAATSFLSAYLTAIWKALVAAVLVSAAVQSLVPRGWAARLINGRSGWRSAAAGAVAGTPSMMCTCCTAPVAATLRREGVGVAGVVAYWLANPLLNPAVIAFLAFVAPWQWTLTRVVVGAIVVVVGANLVARLAPGAPTSAAQDEVRNATEPLDWDWLMGAPARYARSLGRLAAVVTGLAALGLSLGGVGALLLTLPAASLPAMAMLLRPLGWRATVAAAGAVAAGGLLAAGLLSILG